MSRKKQPEQEPQQPVESSPAAGACVLTVVGGVVVAVVFAASETAGILTVCVVAVYALWRSVRRTANPAPPPVPERGCEKKPQFTVVEDRPGHCTVQWTEGA